MRTVESMALLHVYVQTSNFWKGFVFCCNVISTVIKHSELKCYKRKTHWFFELLSLVEYTTQVLVEALGQFGVVPRSLDLIFRCGKRRLNANCVTYVCFILAIRIKIIENSSAVFVFNTFEHLSKQHAAIHKGKIKVAFASSIRLMMLAGRSSDAEVQP